MGKEKDIFDPCFKKTRYYELDAINFDSSLHIGTCHLESHHHSYYLIWSISDYPTEAPMPGASYPVKVEYSLFDKCKKNKTNNSMSGQFIYELTSGTLPQLNAMGIPYGVYKSIARNNKTNSYVNIVFSLSEDPLEVIVSK